MCTCNQTTNTTLCQECESTGCKNFIKSECINNVTTDLECSNIIKGQTLDETLVLLDAYICTKFDSIENFFELINVGTTGARVYKGVSMLGKKELRRLVDSNLINIVEGTDDITISVDEEALSTFIDGVTTTASNVGTGAEVFKELSSNDYKFRKIKSTDNSVTITQGIDDINLSVAIPDGSETKIISGTPNVVIEGNGMEGDEYVINVEIDGSETKINAGTNITKSGIGTIADPFVINAVIPPSTFLTNTPVVLASGKTLGKYTNGQTILSAGKTFEEVIKDIALEYVSPAFSSFTITGQATTVEVGTTLSGSKTFTWGITLNSGIVPTIDIYDNTAASTLLAATTNDGTQAQAITTIQLNANNATQSWKGIANNSNGANVNSSNFVVTSLFNRFWGAVATLPASSVDGTANRVYANLLTTAAKTNGTNTFTLVTGTTSNKFIALLPPGVTITSVIDTGNLGLDITSSYILSTITIKDAGGTDRTYNQYLFNPAGAYPTTTNHVITTN